MRWMLLVSALLFVPVQAQAPAKSMDELKAFYAANCVKCHGADGSAVGPDGKKLGGVDFTDAKRAARSGEADQVKTIRKGIFFGRVMPSFKDRLSEEDMQLLVKEILRKAEKGKVIAP